MLLIRNFIGNRIDSKYLKKIAGKTLKMAGFKKPWEISLVIVGDKKIKYLNRTYRGIDKITDVLSFGNEENGKAGNLKFIVSPDGISYLGEIFVCYPRAKIQARKKGHYVKKELAVLLVHGILHLLGYDHQEEKDFLRMRQKEKEILGKI